MGKERERELARPCVTSLSRSLPIAVDLGYDNAANVVTQKVSYWTSGQRVGLQPHPPTVTDEIFARVKSGLNNLLRVPASALRLQHVPIVVYFWVNHSYPNRPAKLKANSDAFAHGTLTPA
ncbi:unnamed protein product [Schistocephalus solidus]|uniref:Transposase n=1 Tax=Schistocephalus solidus TaxID=70667 RepID=A0A183SV42_SCHSO|nr:unnamed protein product [Schistocephalus solidus]